MNGDILTKINIPQFFEFHDNNGADITIVEVNTTTLVPMELWK